MEASGEPRDSPPPAEPASAERPGNSVTAHAHDAGDPGGPDNPGPSEGEGAEQAEDGLPVDEEGTDALTVARTPSPRTVIGDHSDRLSKQYLQRTSELRGQYGGLVGR